MYTVQCTIVHVLHLDLLFNFPLSSGGNYRFTLELWFLCEESTVKVSLYQEPFIYTERSFLKHFVKGNRVTSFPILRRPSLFPRNLNALKMKWLFLPTTAHFNFDVQCRLTSVAVSGWVPRYSIRVYSLSEKCRISHKNAPSLGHVSPLSSPTPPMKSLGEVPAKCTSQTSFWRMSTWRPIGSHPPLHPPTTPPPPPPSPSPSSPPLNLHHRLPRMQQSWFMISLPIYNFPHAC